jgi:hypothetical protein
LSVTFENFGEAEVGKTNVAIFVHKNVLGLEISVNNFLVVEMSDRHAHLYGVELGAVFCKSLGVSQMHEKFTTADETHYEEYLLVCHKDVAHSNKERMISLQQNILF